MGSGFFYLLKRGEKVIEIEGKKENQQDSAPEESTTQLNKSVISGLACENYNRRPIAVILAEDSVARPLSGISKADLVIEMSVITGGITRMMAIFQCGNPGEIGSLRSARHDFIPLSMGFDSILVHWGGSHYALDLLKKKVMDNIDALVNPYQVFWRKKGIPPPHNGFSSMENLIKAAQKIGFRLENNFEGYSHFVFEDAESGREETKEKGWGPQILKIGYPYPYNVEYEYSPETNSYLRWRSGRPEIDKLNGQQVEAKNIVIMRAKSRQLEKEYNDVDIEGEGKAIVYKNGQEIKGSWQKDKLNPSSKLYFFDEMGEEIEFSPGQIWIEIVEPYQRVSYE